MLRKGLLNVMAGALLISGTTAPAFATDGLVRNQAALGMSGRMTPSMQACVKAAKTAVRTQCAVGENASELRGGAGGGGFVVAILAAAAVVAGIVVVVSNNDETPVSS